jgi:hypothetical protein
MAFTCFHCGQQFEVTARCTCSQSAPTQEVQPIITTTPAPRILVRFYEDFYRNGELEGLFITTKPELERLYGKVLYFGEVLGKHSDVSLLIEPRQFTLKSEDQAFIDQLADVCGTDISGLNPFSYEDDGEDHEYEGEE